MQDRRVLLALLLMSKSRKQAPSRLSSLYTRVKEELMRIEHARLVRIKHYLTVSCLPTPEVAPWMYIWAHGTDENLFTITSLGRKSFGLLMDRFALYYAIPLYRPKGGRPRKLQYHHQVFGLLLAFYVGSMEHKALCAMLGVPHSTLSRVLKHAEDALRQALSGFSPARIVCATIARQEALARLTTQRESMLQFTWGFIDGKNYRIQEPSNHDVQNAYYNEWLHNVYVTGTLCFRADGLIVWCRHHCSGSWNDSDTSFAFREALRDPILNPDKRYGVVADSAFPCSDDMVGRILTPLKEGELGRVILTVREGLVEKVYHRLLHPLPYDRDKRKLRLDNLFRLVN
ncbi:hypothetical protein PHMEG_00018299 [Phytophthora megakarya]|uniref:DDE Tnp4 domain-containing protein n=1 Tax=Phytophthora megakarya TaxID=4795 RepID=A0A225VWX8_9STRA|nr:hypothetical protein PHMEG_00018299 [Phytophthora megakarya]